jgi:site-specific recombinase XerD
VNPKTGTRYQNVKRAWKTLLKRARIEDFRFHDLRHTFASYLVMSGVDLRSVQELMGHKTLTMTQRYSHLAPGHLRSAVENLPKMGTQKAPKAERTPTVKSEPVVSVGVHDAIPA